MVGFDKIVYWDSSKYQDGDLEYETDFRSAVNAAIDEFPAEAVYVYEEISDRSYKVGDTEDIDILNLFRDLSGNPVTVTIESNSDPSAISASIVDNTLTVNALTSTDGVILTLKGTAGEISTTTDLNITAYDPFEFDSLNTGFESGIFVLENWKVKYNTSADGGLNGANLIDPPTTDTWICNSNLTPGLGMHYIHTGDYSAAITYNSPDFNWLISQEMQLDYDDYTLSFWLWFRSSDYPSKFDVLVDDGTKGWTSILAYDGSTPDNNYDSEIEVPLVAFVSKTIRIAFVTEYIDGNHVAIDDIRVWSPTVQNIPAVPANVITNISGTDLVIDWDASVGATSYDVYSSDDPYGTFTLVTNVSTNQYTVPISQAKLFYYVIAKNAAKE